MGRQPSRSRWRGVPTAVAEAFNRRGWSPVALLNRLDRLTPGRDRSRLAREGVPYGPHERHRLDIWGPRAHLDGETLPVVIFFYGGGWHSGSRSEYGFAGAAFARQGFIGVVPDYRLAPSVRYPGFLWDAAMAVRWVRRNIGQFGGDPNRIVLSGHSAGAYIGAMLALDTRWLDGVGLPRDTVKAAVLLSGPYDFAPFRERRGRQAFGHWPDPVETQPITYVRRDAPPILLIHGSSDRIVYAKNSRRLAERLRELGAPVELLVYKGANHADPVIALARPFRDRVPTLDDAVAFLRSALPPPT
ncbi:alpha/beta hydrolase [Sphingomonas sp. GCM10030256]|uniref:alpha/beta hydrolase n=1 Tax=Sphingomonas sp. GCM10030256 TaxID=3273427 RepID=UPI00360E5607